MLPDTGVIYHAVGTVATERDKMIAEHVLQHLYNIPLERNYKKDVILKMSDYVTFTNDLQGAEDFRNSYLIKSFNEAVNRKSKLYVYLDDAHGYASNWLQEVFCKLVTKNNIDKSLLLNHLVVASENELYVPFVKLAQKYIEEA